MPLQVNHEIVKNSGASIQLRELTDVSLAGLTPPVFGEPTPVTNAGVLLTVFADDETTVLISNRNLDVVLDENTVATNYYEGFLTVAETDDWAVGQRLLLDIFAFVAPFADKSLRIREWAMVVERP